MIAKNAGVGHVRQTSADVRQRAQTLPTFCPAGFDSHKMSNKENKNDHCRRGTSFWSQKDRNYRRLDGKIQDTFLKNTGDLKGDFNDKYNKKKTFFHNWYGL